MSHGNFNISFNIFLLVSERKGEGKGARYINEERESLAASCMPHTGG